MTVLARVLRPRTPSSSGQCDQLALERPTGHCMQPSPVSVDQ